MPKVIIEPTHISGERGQWYRVHHAGRVLIEKTWNPEYDACRALLAIGVTGRAEFWRPSATYPSSSIDIVRGAQWTIKENEHHGPIIVRYDPFVAAGERLKTADHVPAVAIPPQKIPAEIRGARDA